MTCSSNICNTDLYGIRDAIDRLELESASDNDVIIEQSTTMLDELDVLRAALLATRARAFRRKGALAQAIKNASKAIEARPTSVQGYLELGGVYTLQGRHQLALSVLEDGLRSVLPSDWPLLYEKRETSLRSLEKKVDFVRILPPEISASVFSLVSSEDDIGLVSCTLVSKYWRASILGYPELWENAEFGLGNPNGAVSLLRAVSTHVKKLTFYPSKDTKQYKFLRELASKLMLPRVVELVTEACLFSEYRKHKLNVGALLGKQLTKLVLCSVNWSKQKEPSNPISLGPILIQCPNLKHLYLNFTYSPPDLICLGPSEISGRLKLETVYSSFQANCDTVILERLIPHCPSLLYLRTRSPKPRILSLLGRHCPKLRRLHAWSYLSHTLTEDHESDRQDTGGLKEICCEVSNVSQMRSLAPFFVKSKDSLEVLYLYLTDPASTVTTPEYSHHLPNIEYSQLKVFDCRAQTFDDSISKIIRQSPVLDSIVFNISDTVPDDFFLTLTQLSHLRRLRVEAVHSCGGLEEFFDAFSARGQGSTLEGVQIQGCEAVTDEILHSLAGVMTLQTVVIRGPFPSTTPEGTSKFLRKLGANANLAFLLMYDVFLADYSAEEQERIVCLKVRHEPEDDFNGFQLGDMRDHFFDY